MITVEQLESNKKKFLETNSKYKIFTKELENFLGDDFYTAPATTTIDMYGCYPGGLLNSSLKACKYAIKINELLPENMRQETSTILKCIFLYIKIRIHRYRYVLQFRTSIITYLS